jgi:hypothetical protein
VEQAVFGIERAVNPPFGALAHEIQAPFESRGILTGIGLAHKQHTNIGHYPPGQVARGLRIHRHLSPAQKDEPFLMRGISQCGLGRPAQVTVCGQKHQSGGIVRFNRELDVRLPGRFFQKPVRLLDQYAGAVAGGFVAAAGAAVSQVHQDLQGVLHQCVSGTVVEVADHACAAGVVFECRMVEAVIAGALGRRDEGWVHGVSALSFESCPNGNNVWGN